MLREEFRRYLDIRAKANIPAPWDVSVAEFRNLTMPNPAFIGVPEPIHNIEHRNIAGLTGYLPIRIYRPSDEPNLPVLVYFHGGGWVIGNMDGFEPTVRSLANKANLVVIQVQYQKAPEHPFPTPFDDCYTTLEWVVKNAATLKIDSTKIGVGGDSAGGNLAAGVAMKCRDEKLVDLAFQMLVYPCTGHDESLPSAIANSEGYGLTSKVMRWYEAQYSDQGKFLNHPYAFPATATNFSGLAPAVIVTAEYDPLADDGEHYANLLKQAGVTVVFKEYEGAIHGFNALAGIAPEIAAEVQRFLSSEINNFLGREKSIHS